MSAQHLPVCPTPGWWWWWWWWWESLRDVMALRAVVVLGSPQWRQRQYPAQARWQRHRHGAGPGPAGQGRIRGAVPAHGGRRQVAGRLAVDAGDGAAEQAQAP